jgi:hypothetical protein
MEKAHSRDGIYPRKSSIVGPTLPSQQDLQLQKGTLRSNQPI